MKPFVKWAGGKENELSIILKNLPNDINNYIEPFVGGGAVYFGINDIKITGKKYINDFSRELIDLYKCVSEKNPIFFKKINEIDNKFKYIFEVAKDDKGSLVNVCNKYRNENDLIQLDNDLENILLNNKEKEYSQFLFKSLKRKIKRIVQLENGLDNKFDDVSILKMIETGYKDAYYLYIRNKYNELKKMTDIDVPVFSAYFYFIREYCYSSMFRYNLSGEFNVPYGGMAYNVKSMSNKLDNMCSAELINYLKETKIVNKDFEKFLKEIRIKENDFIFVDPPYDSEFSEYANNSFTREDQERLAKFLSKVKCRVMVVIKNTDFIYDLYKKYNFTIETFGKKYSVNFKNRNDRNVKHLMIKNY